MASGSTRATPGWRANASAARRSPWATTRVDDPERLDLADLAGDGRGPVGDEQRRLRAGGRPAQRFIDITATRIPIGDLFGAAQVGLVGHEDDEGRFAVRRGGQVGIDLRVDPGVERRRPGVSVGCGQGDQAHGRLTRPSNKRTAPDLRSMFEPPVPKKSHNDRTQQSGALF